MKLPLFTFSLIPWSSLNFSTIFAELKPRARLLLSRNGISFTTFGWFTEINISKHHSLYKFKSKRHIRRFNTISFFNILGIKICQHLTNINLRFAIFITIVNSYFSVIAIGNRLLKSQQHLFLGDVGPHWVATTGARHLAIGTYIDILHMLASRTHAPIFKAR